MAVVSSRLSFRSKADSGSSKHSLEAGRQSHTQHSPSPTHPLSTKSDMMIPQVLPIPPPIQVHTTQHLPAVSVRRLESVVTQCVSPSCAIRYSVLRAKLSEGRF